MAARWDTFQIEVEIRKMPDGRDGVLLQFEHGYIITSKADDAQALGEAIIEAAEVLRTRQRTEQN